MGEQNFSQFDFIHNGIVVLDKELNVKFWNKWFEVYSGIDRENIVGRNLKDVFPYLDEKVLIRKIKTVLLIKSSAYYEMGESGYFIKISNRKITNKIYDNMIQKVVISLLDFENELFLVEVADRTEAAESELRLKQNEALMDSLFEQSSESAVLINNEGAVCNTNLAFLDLCGIKKNKIIGKKLEDFIFVSDRKIFSDYMSASESEKPGGDFIEIRVLSEAKPLWVMLSYSRIVTDFSETFLLCSLRDITKIKESENKLMQQHKYFQSVLDTQKEMVVVSDGESIKNCNKRFLEFVGLSSLDEFKEKHRCVCSLFLDESGNKIDFGDDWTCRFFEEEESDQNMVYMKSLGGDIRSYLVNVSKFPMFSGEYLAVFTDVTDIDNYRKALKDTNQVLTDIIDGRTKQMQILNRNLSKNRRQLDLAQKIAGVGSWEYIPERDVFVCSEFLQEFIGFEHLAGELDKNEMYSYINEFFLPDFISSMESCLNDGEDINIELKLMINDSEKLVIAHGMRIIEEDSSFRILGTFNDISDLRAMEHKLYENEMLIANIFDIVSVGLCMVGDNREILKINREFCQMTGYEELEVVGSDYLEMLADDQREEFISIHTDLMCGKLSSKNTRRTYLGKSGNLIEAVTTIRLMFINDKKVLVIAISDVTKLIESERKQREQEQMLIQQSKMAAMGEMISIIAHQWKQPLSVVGLMTQIIEDDYACGELTEALLKDNLGMISSQVNHMSNTIETFRNFFKPSSEDDIFKVSKAIDDTMFLVGAQLEKNNVKICVDIHGTENVYVKGLKNEFSHVIVNLLVNAKDALHESYEKKLIEFADMKVFLKAEIRGDDVCIIVEDWGTGIPEHILANMFKPYVTSKGEEGTGIGLYMASLIINRMKGTITASNGEKGAVFKVCLPIYQ